MPTSTRHGEPGHAHLTVAVDDPDAHHDRAKAAGWRITSEPRDTDHGSRDYSAADGEGNTWYFGSYRPLT